MTRADAVDALLADRRVTIDGRPVVLAWWPERIACYADTREVPTPEEWARARVEEDPCST